MTFRLRRRPRICCIYRCSTRWRVLCKVAQPPLGTLTLTICLFDNAMQTFPFRDIWKPRRHRILECLLNWVPSEVSRSWDFRPPPRIHSTVCRVWRYSLFVGSWTSTSTIQTLPVRTFNTLVAQAVLGSPGSSMLCGTYLWLEASCINSR